MPPLSPRDRALIHLFDTRAHLVEDASPEGATQGGIASALGMNRTHVTRVLKPLIESGLLSVDKGHIEGRDRILTHYRLTEAGLAKARELVNGLAEEELEVAKAGLKAKMRFREVRALRPDMQLLRIADAIGGTLVIEEEKRLVLSNVDLKEERFLDREAQLEEAERFFDSASTLLAVYAGHGYGSSAFARRISLNPRRSEPLLWHDLRASPGPAVLMERLGKFEERLAERGAGELKDAGAILCFDNYHDAPEQVVDVLFDLNRRLKGGRTKMIVALRPETPSYSRFYQREDVSDGTVVEVRLDRFDETVAGTMLGLDLDDEASHLLYLLTKGQPLAIELLRDGDEAGLRKIRLNEEARFMMHLRARTKK